MPMFRKKPVVIEARLIVSDLLEDLAGWCHGKLAHHAGPDSPPTGIDIHTREGTLHGSLGDYLVQDVQGEFYLCKPDIFHETYEEENTCCNTGIPSPFLPFQSALLYLKQGAKVRRSGWNGKGMWLEYVPAHAWARLFGNTTDYQNRPFIAMKDAQDGYVPWLASQTDLLAEDWEFAD